jgi:chromosome segregation ATPase
MRTLFGPCTSMALGFAAMLLACAASLKVQAADDPAVAHAREMLRRTQEALHQAQSDNADLLKAKTDAEQKLQAAVKEIDAAKNGTKAAQASLSAKLTSVEGAQTDLAQKLADANERLAAAGRSQADTARQLSARESELAQIKQSLEQSRVSNVSCEDKNLKLFTYGQQVLERYRTKGVWTALSQKDPVLGLKEVDVENVVQEYQLKMAGAKLKGAP